MTANDMSNKFYAFPSGAGFLSSGPARFISAKRLSDLAVIMSCLVSFLGKAFFSSHRYGDGVMRSVASIVL